MALQLYATCACFDYTVLKCHRSSGPCLSALFVYISQLVLGHLYLPFHYFITSENLREFLYIPGFYSAAELSHYGITRHYAICGRYTAQLQIWSHFIHHACANESALGLDLFTGAYSTQYYVLEHIQARLCVLVHGQLFSL